MPEMLEDVGSRKFPLVLMEDGAEMGQKTTVWS